MFKEKLSQQWFLVVVVLLLGILVASLLFVFKPQAERKPVDIKSPHVDVMVAKSKWQAISVSSQGRVRAARRIDLSTEVNGRIIKLADNFKDGAYFQKGEMLLKIDPREYQLAVVRAEAQVAAAEQNLIRAEAEAAQAKKDLSRLSTASKNKISPYALREPQLKEAQAKLKAARADLALAQLKLEKTSIRAPFSGRVIKKKVSLGQYVVAATQLAEFYDGLLLQVKLPVRLQQLGLLLGKDKPPEISASNGLTIALKLAIAGSTNVWKASVQQLDSVIDKDNQLINLLAEIKQSRNNAESRMLLPGTFVQAEISSAVQQNIFVLPRQVLRSNNELWLLNNNNQLNKVHVDVLYKSEANVFVSAGINDGEKIIVSSIDSPIEGMKLEGSMELNE